ncbi:hypothetical protein ACLUEY_14080 [Vreelandella aquamarina]
MNAKLAVSDFIVKRQKELGLPNADLANALNYDNHNVITMIRKGRARVPLHQIMSLASVLKVDSIWFFKLVMSEYKPETLEVIEQCLGSLVTQNERRLLAVWRANTSDCDPEITDELKKGMTELLKLKGSLK